MTKVFRIFLSNEAQIIREQKIKMKKNCMSKLSSVHTLVKVKIFIFALLSF